MRIITGCIRPTDVHWLPVLSNIAPPTIRREKAAHKIYNKFRDKIDSLLFNFITNIPPARLKSRRSPFQEINESFDGNERWKRLWSENRPFNGELIQDPSEEVPGFDLPRSIWTSLNRFRTGQGRCNYQLQKWGYREDPSCSCGHPKQTTSHIVEDCEDRKFPGGVTKLHLCSTSAVTWLRNLDLSL